MKRVVVSFWISIVIAAMLLLLILGGIFGILYFDLLLAVVALGLAIEMLFLEVMSLRNAKENHKLRTDMALLTQWMEETQAESHQRKSVADNRIVRLDARRAALERKLSKQIAETKKQIKATDKKLTDLNKKVRPHLRHLIVRKRR
ncbi:MAG: hypothetical protein KKA90_00450 [Nanoarchaeota archaeon]|nr:hypothetical protein [Nanoarchaeota archaeon]